MIPRSTIRFSSRVPRGTNSANIRRSALVAVATIALASSSLAQNAPTAPVPETPVTSQPAQRVVVVSAQPVGVDARAASLVTEELQKTLTSAGYDVVPADQTQQALTALGLTYASTPADLWKVTYAARAALGVTATVRAEGGQYVLDLTVADATGRGPFTGQARSDAPGLLAATSDTLRKTLPSAESPPPAPSTTPPAPPPAQPSAAPAYPVAQPMMVSPSNPEIDHARTSEAPAKFKRLRLALQTEAAFGTTDDGFYNHLVGARLDYRFARKVSLGGYLGYANLKGREGRENNVLPYAQMDYRIFLDRGGTVQVPLRFGAGYLPKNGPFLRFAVGIAVDVSPDVELLLDVAAPALWVTKDLTVVSFDVAGEVGYMP